jgi:hypothetical protein
VDPVPDPLLLRKSSSAGNRTRTSGLAARKPDLQSYKGKIIIKREIHNVKMLAVKFFFFQLRFWDSLQSENFEICSLSEI